MTLQLKFIWLLFNLCAIVGGSSGFSIFPSKEPFSASAPVEEQKLGYTPSASPFLNGPAIQPPLTSHPFESSPPGPENIQPLPPQVPSTANVSPAQSVAAAPHDKSPGPDASVKVSPSKEPPASATPPPGVPLHDLTLQQPAPSPVFLAPLHPVPEAPLHDLAPQSSARVYAPPPVVALPDVPDLSHKQPVAAPYASASPQASISTHASRPASTAVPSRFSSLPPSAISSHTSVPSPPVMPSHVFASPPPISPPTSGAMPPFATSHDSATPPPAISPSILSSSPPVLPLHSSAAPPPLRSQYASAPSIVAMPSPTVGQRPSASSPHAFSSSPHASSTPTHTIKPHKLASSPPFVPPEGRPSADLAPPPSTTNLPRDSAPSSTAQPELPHDLSTPSTPMTSRSSAPLSPVGSVVLSPHSPPIRKHALPIPVVLPSHLASPLPAVAPHGPSPFLDAGPPHALRNVTPPVPSGSSAPPPVDVPSRDFGSSPAVSPYAFATPKPRVPSHSSTPPPQAMPSPVTGPPRPSTIPPIAIPLPALFPPPPEKPVLAPPPTYTPHVSAPPPSSTITEHPPPQSPPAPMHASYPPPDGLSPIVSLPPPKAAPSHAVAPSPPATSPYVSAPPPNATISEHSSAPPPPTPPIHVSNPPPQVTPPIVSPSPPEAAPSHGLAPFPPAETRFSAPPPSSTRHFSTPPTSSPAAKNASYPPSASVTPHTSAPSTSAELPLAASPPSAHTVTPGSLPPVAYQRKKPKSQLSPVPSNSSAPLVAPPVRSPSIIPVVPREPPSIPPEAQLPHVSSPAPSIHQRGDHVPVIVAPSGPTFPLSPTSHQPKQGFSPYIAPTAHKSRWVPVVAPVATISPPISPLPEAPHGPSISPLPSTSEAHPRNSSQSAPETSYIVPSPAPKQQGQDESPDSSLAPAPESAQRYHSPFSHQPGSSAAMAPSPSPLTENYISPVSMPAIPVQSPPSMTPFLPPTISPSVSSTKKPKLSPPILALPPPPPNRDCLSITCAEPYTNTIAGSPCGCILPMKVELRIGVALYTFFPLVPELAREVATGIFMKQSQVRIMGANAASEQPDKTLLLIDLVPLGDKFDNITAFLIFERFWNKQVAISESLFGDYEVLYVQYPGLPPSPPMAPSDIAAINGGPYPGDNGSKIHPLGVDITKQGRKHRLSGSLIAIIVFSAVGAGLLCLLLGWIFLFRHRREVTQSAEAPHVYPSSIARSTGPTGQSAGSRPSFSLSFESSVAAYTGSAKTFSAGEIEKATDNFDSSRVLGEGGFGRVYSGVLEDGTEVAVKVLKREDQQGGREFLAEIEMLSRLHHRNLVKLIGMCVEEHSRCLVYELIPNGSVESHLHGVGGQTSPLDWATRMKVALGAARGLAYLHEDSSPRVIHRDFKASNILLEADFTPKVSDFGLARTAMDEENRHVSTRVMGTFGYVAPEYAMTGHLLVKSDVYSYGVVLLELLTGRKPVDMSQPPGQENLVAWTRPYLTSKEALKSIVDASLGPDISFDSVAKVAAIASMCVQPEVSHRPFMGEVVQALKLVCNECDGSKDEGDESPTSCSPENSLNEAREPMQSRSSAHSYGSGGNGEDVEKGLSKSDIFSARDTGLGCEESDSFRRHSSSGPIGSGRSWRFWKRGRTTSSREGVGEHGMYRFWSGSH